MIYIFWNFTSEQPILSFTFQCKEELKIFCTKRGFDDFPSSIPAAKERKNFKIVGKKLKLRILRRIDDGDWFEWRDLGSDCSSEF